MKKYILLFLIGGIGYYLLEVIWRGYSHWTMALTGGICFGSLYIISMKTPVKSKLIKALLGSIAITTIEFIVGIIVNIIFQLEVWDYSTLPLNFYGQICIWFSILWFFLCIPVMLIFERIHQRGVRRDIF